MTGDFLRLSCKVLRSPGPKDGSEFVAPLAFDCHVRIHPNLEVRPDTDDEWRQALLRLRLFVFAHTGIDQNVRTNCRYDPLQRCVDERDRMRTEQHFL